MTEPISIEKIILVYENGTRLVLEGDKAQQMAAEFFRINNQTHGDWKIEELGDSPRRGIVGRMDDFLYKLFTGALK